jgi:hypothetical protein
MVCATQSNPIEPRGLSVHITKHKYKKASKISVSIHNSYNTTHHHKRITATTEMTANPIIGREWTAIRV